ncbi:MAG: hypothetical protein SOU07_00535 [Bacilli bacterium]|nr:hypothetical protein [Acholeplasmataceae bacterium]MDY2901915.1 hypothetical protein [Bacilli bacterium]
MKRITKVLIICFLIMFLVACDKKPSDEAEARKVIKQAFDTLSIGEEINHSLILPKTLKVNNYIVNLSYESSDESIMTNKGEIIRMFDDQLVTLNITGEINNIIEKISKEIIVLGTKQDFRPANEVEKQKILEELETNISSTLTKIKENNGSTITNEISVSINGELITQSNKIKIKNDPLYLETIDENNNLNVYKEEDQKIIKYIVYKNHIYRNLETSTKDEILNSIYNESLDSDFFVNLECEKKDKDYTFKASVKNILNTEIGMEIKELLQSMGDLDDLEELPIYFKLQVDEDSIINTAYLNYKIENLGYVFCNVKTTYKMEDIVEYEFPKDLKIELPKTIDSVTSYSKLGEEIEVYKSDYGYFRYDLKRGTYCLDSDGNFNSQGVHSYHNYKIYDQNGKLLHLSLDYTPSKRYYGFLGMNYVFTIPSDGIYYIKMENYEQKDILFTVRKLDYESGCSLNKAKDVVSTTGTINGLYDFHIFKTNTKGFYTLTNMGDKTIFIAIPTIQDTFEYLEVLPNKEVFIYLNNYRYCFFVCANEQQESYTYNFKIENREEELKYASSNDFQKMPNLETNKSYLFSNAEYDKKWFKINIESKGEYKFDTSASNFYIQIKTINNEYIDRANVYKLDIGEYIIEIGYSGDNNKYSIDQKTIIFKQIS